jgi:hypothetical protein
MIIERQLMRLKNTGKLAILLQKKQLGEFWDITYLTKNLLFPHCQYTCLVTYYTTNNTEIMLTKALFLH